MPRVYLNGKCTLNFLRMNLAIVIIPDWRRLDVQEGGRLDGVAARRRDRFQGSKPGADQLQRFRVKVGAGRKWLNI